MFGRKRVESISDFLDVVADLQKEWDANSELWFRGESVKHKRTSLVPKVYRPNRPVDDLLKAEYRIWQDFMRCGQQLCDVLPENDLEWYFLMQHHRSHRSDRYDSRGGVAPI